MSRHGRLWLGLLAVLGILAGCTGIPSSSAPQVVRTVERSANPAISQHISPVAGDPPGGMVDGFIRAGVDAGAAHSTARQFLTTKAANGWKDNQTVILTDVNIGEPSISGNSAQVQVTGRRVGQLDDNGIFSPTLKGMGSGDEELFDFTLTRGADAQWRIDHPPPGVLITSVDFINAYRQRVLYFMDSAQKIVVPDLRYSSLSGPQLASWLLTELVAGPRPELTQTVVNAVPDQVGKPSVQIGTPTIVDLPGTAQLDVASHSALATELAFTLDQVDEVQLNGGQLELTDSGKPVRIAEASGVQFSAANFCSASRAPIGPLTAYCTTSSDSGPYFVRYGAVLQLNDKGAIVPLPGQLGQPSRNFGSVAVRQGSGGSRQVAGLVGRTQLQIGNGQRLTPIRLPQPATSRPEWQPFSDNVWIGTGNRIYRATAGGPVLPVSLTSQLGALPAGPITAVRISSDGDRVALVIQGPAGIGSVWIGSVITSGADVRVDSLEPVTPTALAVTDVAWADTIRLDMVAAEPGAAARMWSVYSDGYSDGLQVAKFSNQGLPGPPTAIAAAPGQSVVSVGNASSGTIWLGTGSSWVSLSGTDVPVPGINPVFAS